MNLTGPVQADAKEVLRWLNFVAGLADTLDAEWVRCNRTRGLEPPGGLKLIPRERFHRAIRARIPASILPVNNTISEAQAAQELASLLFVDPRAVAAAVDQFICDLVEARNIHGN